MFSRFATRANMAKTVLRRSQSTMTAGSNAVRVGVPAAAMATAVGAAYAYYQSEAHAEGSVLSYLERSVPCSKLEDAVARADKLPAADAHVHVHQGLVVDAGAIDITARTCFLLTHFAFLCFSISKRLNTIESALGIDFEVRG